MYKQIIFYAQVVLQLLVLSEYLKKSSWKLQGVCIFKTLFNLTTCELVAKMGRESSIKLNCKLQVFNIKLKLYTVYFLTIVYGRYPKVQLIHEGVCA